jgi:hypothetical protein
VWVLLPLLLQFSSLHAQQKSELLDDFDTLAGWKTITSEGAALTLALAKGRTGNALEMDFDLSRVSGYVIAEKEFHRDLPSDYQFTFDMRAEAPVNNFEFKILDDHDNVYWIKKLNIEYPKEWAKQRIKKRHLSFAWGPAPGLGLHSVRKIEFALSTGTGGKGKVWIDNFRFEPIDDSLLISAAAEFVGRSGNAALDSSGRILSHWISSPEGGRDSLEIDMHRRAEIGGLVIDWDATRYATAYDVFLSDDGKEWSPLYSVSKGKGGRTYISTGGSEGQYVKLVFLGGEHQGEYAIGKMELKGPDFSSSPNAFYHSIAADAPSGWYPKYFRDKQSYWTVMGVNGDVKESLINEQGEIEVDKQQFMIEPFLFINGKLVTWSSVKTEHELAKGYLPVPTVIWNFEHLWSLEIQSCVAGSSTNSLLGIRYRFSTQGENVNGKLYLAIRPFQVLPPWQQLNIEGGVSKIDSVTYRQGFVGVNGMTIVPLTTPTAFGAAEFDQGDITEYLAHSVLPVDQEAHDHFGHASAALQYDLHVESGASQDVVVMVPLHGWRKSPVPDMRYGDAEIYYDLMSSTESGRWDTKLNTVRFDLPPAQRAIANTIRSNLAYIFINRDGPGIQPGSRTYERSWIRDGALTSSALLRCGYTEEVREFIDWYAKNQFPNGKIPCVVDSHGPDTVPEHESNGEFIYAVMQYFMFTRDTTWLQGKFDAVEKTVRYIQSLRAERKTETYKNGTPEQRSFYGLVPESISHEGYSDAPRHSYWDDFFTLRGLKDATTIAGILGRKEVADEFAAERDDLKKDLYASMRLAMKNKRIDFIPGCAELGDFDATSTTIGIIPGGELGNIPEPELRNTFDKYYSYFLKRKTDSTIQAYTPYETRVIGAFVELGEKKRAEDALNFFMNDRRPAGWNEWAEVVWRDRDTPKYIGDMPHTWVGSDFIRSVLTMFLYERERDGAIVLAAGIPDSWLEDSTGVRVSNLRTYDGAVSYSLKKKKNTVMAEISALLVAGHHPVVLTSPLARKIRSITINGVTRSVPKSGEVTLQQFPVKVEFRY